MPTATSNTDRWIGLGLILVTLGFFGIGIGEGSHFDSDDALYAQMAREMWLSGDWIDNRWSGVVVFEKPPLLLWTMALSGGLGDWTEAALRWPMVGFAALAIWSLFGIFRRLGASSRSAVAGCLLLLTSWYFVMMTRRLMTDLPLVACGLFSLNRAISRRWAASGLGAGLAVLAKGVAAGPLVVSTVIIATWCGRAELRTTAKGIGIATLTALLVALPWHVAVTVRHGAEFWSAYVGHHVGERASAQVVPGIALGDLGRLLLQDVALILAATSALGMALWTRATGRSISPLVVAGLVWSTLAAAPVILSATRLPHYGFPLVVGLSFFVPAAVPARLWAARVTPAIIGAVVVTAFLTTPDRVALWLNADLAPAQKALGGVIAERASADDLVAAFDTTTAALTFYAGGRPFDMLAADPTFARVQETVLMNRTVGLLRPIGTDPIPAQGSQRRFIVSRSTDVPEVIRRLTDGTPRPLFIVRVLDRALVNDAGVGDSVDGH